jgi:hypothetical protein
MPDNVMDWDWSSKGHQHCVGTLNQVTRTQLLVHHCPTLAYLGKMIRLDKLEGVITKNKI